MGALLSLNLANNDLGVQVPIEDGWRHGYNGGWKWIHTDDREQQEAPPMEPRGAIAIANAIPDMRALTTLDISKNKLTRGALKAGLRQGQSGGDDSHYETDMTGMTPLLGVFLIPYIFLCRYYRCCRRHQGYGGVVVAKLILESSGI
jgi:hypothetical protein